MFITRPLPSFHNGYATGPGESEWPSLWNGLVGMWSPCIGNQGITQIYDFSRYHRHGVMNGSIPASAWTVSPLGRALTFDGTNDYLETTFQSAFTGLDPFSFDAWIKTSDANRGCVIGDYVSGASLNPLEVTAAGQLRAYLNGGAGVIKDYVTTGAVINDGIWRHVAMTYDGAQGLKLYVNGLERAVTKTTDNTLTSATIGSGSPMRIGSDRRAASGIFLAGDIAIVRAWSRNLTSHAVLALYMGASPQTLRNSESNGGVETISQVNVTDQFIWNTRAKTQETTQAIWNTRAKVQDPSVLRYNVRSSFQKASDLRWSVRTRMASNKSVQALWSVRAKPSASKQVLWNVASDIVTVPTGLPFVVPPPLARMESSRPAPRAKVTPTRAPPGASL